ncbi:MAG: hypothetical protein CVU36_23720 [Betaproteobacteria bacterium HGW-Betaproteobacteria-9]|nr:MAG: hypothetical protein CVU36_23720 [Betaproteobacteria bacterium HGW-Betaproteobacteria-9]
MKKSLFIKTAVALALAAPLLASAESDLEIGTGAAAARLNFQVVIPRVLFLAVGTGNATLADNGTIDTLTYDYSANPADVGSGTDSAAQGVNVRVLGNNGQIAIAAAGSGAGLVSDLDAADIIPWSEILATSSVGAFAAPAVGASANPTLSAGKVTNRTAIWNYAYSNTAVAAPGTYSGQVTYTATMP